MVSAFGEQPFGVSQFALLLVEPREVGVVQVVSGFGRNFVEQFLLGGGHHRREVIALFGVVRNAVAGDIAHVGGALQQFLVVTRLMNRVLHTQPAHRLLRFFLGGLLLQHALPTGDRLFELADGFQRQRGLAIEVRALRLDIERPPQVEELALGLQPLAARRRQFRQHAGIAGVFFERGKTGRECFGPLGFLGELFNAPPPAARGQIREAAFLGDRPKFRQVAAEVLQVQ